MAIYFINTLIHTPDYVKLKRGYSSLQSISKARNKGLLPSVKLGGMSFIRANAELTAQCYQIASWHEHNIITTDKLPGNLILLRNIRKATAVGELTVVNWALTNKLDLYWAAGRLFADTRAVMQVAATHK